MIGKIPWDRILLALNITKTLLGVAGAIIFIMIGVTVLSTVMDGTMIEGITFVQSNHTVVELTTPDSLVMVTESTIMDMGTGSNTVINVTGAREAME